MNNVQVFEPTDPRVPDAEVSVSLTSRRSFDPSDMNITVRMPEGLWRVIDTTSSKGQIVVKLRAERGAR